MRKRTVKNIANNIFWYIIYTLPIILWLFYLLWTSYNSFGLGNTINSAAILNSFTEVGYSLYLDYVDPITESIVNVAYLLMGDLSSPAFFAVLSLGWFVNAHILHIFIDAILFIPRLAHKWMEKCTVEE